MLFDSGRARGDTAIRGEILGILESLFPNFLNARDFRTAALVLREAKVLAERAPDLSPEQHQRLDGFVAKLSEPAIVSQLVQSLDEAPAWRASRRSPRCCASSGHTALEPVLTWIPSLSSPQPLRRISRPWPTGWRAHIPPEVLRILRTADQSQRSRGVIALCGRLGLASGGAGARRDASATPIRPIRLASVQALAQLGTPAALGVHRQGDRRRRSREYGSLPSAWPGAAGTRERSSGSRQVVLGKSVKEMDLTEKMAFFEAYGAIAGAAGLKALTSILLPRGLLKLKESSETRACAAIAIGKIRDPRPGRCFSAPPRTRISWCGTP